MFRLLALLRLAPLLLLSVSLAAGEQPARGKIWTFDADPAGSAPAGFEFARTGRGAEGKWVVRADTDKPSNHVLIQESADPTDYRFPLAVLKEGSYKDVTLSVRAKPLSGNVDQGFGLVWRYKDANNYYVTRCNADEDNCTILPHGQQPPPFLPEQADPGGQEHVAHDQNGGHRKSLCGLVRRDQGPRRHR